MKKIITLLSVSAFALLFNACDSKKSDAFVGYWYESETDNAFEVIKNGQQYIVRNINGDLPAELKDGKICGENTLGMPYCMSSNGDQATYVFADIETIYKRIEKREYDKYMAGKPKNVYKPIENEGEQSN